MKTEGKKLFLCNTVYQVMVAVWIKYYELQDDVVDIIISDHMNGGSEIADNIKGTKLFNNVYYSKTLEQARYRIKKSRIGRIMDDLFPNQEIKRYVNLTNNYTDVYIANCDGFSQLLYNILSRRNSKIKLHIFEDGLSTYCELEKYYNSFKNFYYQDEAKTFLKRFIREKIYRKKTIYGNLDEVLVFNPSVMKWNPKCKVRELEKINNTDCQFLNIINTIFNYYDSTDLYDRKYIFFEESFFADGESINDVELIDKLAEKVGKDNIMIKIHPRNPINRFEERGYKTNKNTSIPWEVILLNLGDVSDKIFLTIASSAVLNPMMIFGSNIKAYSLFLCLDIKPKRLSGESWEFLRELFERYSDMITICNTINEIN